MWGKKKAKIELEKNEKENKLNETNGEFNKILKRQKYQNLISDRIFNKTEEALEVTKVLLKSVEGINSSMEEHNKQVNRTADVSSEVGAFSEEVSASVEENINIIDETTNRAINGQKSVNNVIKSINDLKDTVEGMRQVLVKLSKRSEKITDIVSTIKEISNTTNLLSLNANIEAARAGDAGKGFGVVANEVKKLAESSSKSADEINTIIVEVTNLLDETLSIMNTGVDKVIESVEVAKEAGNAIDDMALYVNKTKTITNQISQAVKEQADKNQYMISVIDEMVKVADNISTCNENISINADRQIASLNTLKDSILNLNELSKTDQKTDISNITNFVRTISGIDTFDPAMAVDVSTADILFGLNLGLVQFGSGTEVIGALAKNWHVESDNVTWNFNLRKDIKFHNGRNITSHDVKYSFERLLSNKLNSPNSWFLSMIKGADEYSSGNKNEVEGIIITGEYSLKIVLKYPYSAFSNNLAHISCSILPKEEIETINMRPVGAGPFKFVQKDEQNKEIILEKFNEYALGKAFLDKVIVKYDMDNNVDEFINKNVDFLMLDSDDVKKVAEHGYIINKSECIGLRMLCFNFRSNNPLIKNKMSRQAINYCIDKEKIIKDAFGDIENPLKGVFPKSILNTPDIDVYSKNIIKAKQLLDKSKVKNKSLTLQIINNKSNVHKIIAQIVAQNLKEIGIDLKIIETSAKKYYSEEFLKQSDIFIYGWLGDSGTADNFIEPLIDINNNSNREKYNNPQLMDLLEKVKKERNPYMKREILCDMEKKILDDAPWIFLSNICTAYAYQDKVKGAKMHPLSLLNIADIWKED